MTNSNLNNFIVENVPWNNPYGTEQQGANFVKNCINKGNIKTQGDLRYLARHMYRFSGNTNWFRGGLKAIVTHTERLEKLRNKWRKVTRSAKSIHRLQRREIGR